MTTLMERVEALEKELAETKDSLDAVEHSIGRLVKMVEKNTYDYESFTAALTRKVLEQLNNEN